MFKRKRLLEMRLYPVRGELGQDVCQCWAGAPVRCRRRYCAHKKTLSAGPGMTQALMRAEVDCRL